MAVRYAVPDQEHSFEQEIKHSRFIATVFPAESVAEARDSIREIAARYADATHNCWAFHIGIGPHAEIGSSDDGEPGGTAGRPMLLVLQGSQLGDLGAVVTRYYGGTKLGTGGLVRAYGGTLQKAINDLPTRERVIRRRGMIAIDYARYEQLKRLLEAFDPVIETEDFATDVALVLALPIDQWDACATAVIDFSHATAELIDI